MTRPAVRAEGELGRAGHWAERERKRGSGPVGFGIFGLGFGSSLFYSLS